jgi:hypothetical protein
MQYIQTSVKRFLSSSRNGLAYLPSKSPKFKVNYVEEIWISTTEEIQTSLKRSDAKHVRAKRSLWFALQTKQSSK